MKPLAAFFALTLFAQQPETRLNPTVKQIVDGVSEERIAMTLKKLEGFGTRYILSSQDDPSHGIGAAKRWIHDELQSYSPRLQVSYQDFTVKKGARRGQVIRDVDLANIVAVLPGTTQKDHYVLVTGHYDSVALVRKKYTGEDQMVAEAVRQGIDADEYRRYLKILPPERELGPLDMEATAAQTISPGVTDDGSGTAAVMELARVMSGYQFDKTVVFVAFAAEEVGLSGSQVYAAQAKKDGMQIEAVLNNDIIGSDVSGQRPVIHQRCTRVLAGPRRFRAARTGALHQAGRRTLRAVYAGGDGFPPRPILARRRSHAVHQRRLSGGTPDHRERKLRQSAHGDGYVRQYVSSLCNRALLA